MNIKRLTLVTKLFCLIITIIKQLEITEKISRFYNVIIINLKFKYKTVSQLRSPNNSPEI